MLRHNTGSEGPGGFLPTLTVDASAATSDPITVRERVVIVPCSAGSPRHWQPLMADLEAFETIGIDLAGHGDRPAPTGAVPFELIDEAAAVAAACGDGEPIHLVGHSYGGAVALKFAERHPERVRSLTLVEPTSFHVLRSTQSEEAGALDEITTLAAIIDRAVARGDDRAAMATFIDYWKGSGAWDAMAESTKTRLARLAALVVRHFRSLIGDTTSLAAYRRVTAPTLILCGTRSPQPARVVSRILADTLPAARHRTIRDVRHMAPITHPAAVHSRIIEHLLRHGMRPAPSHAEPCGVF